MTAHFRRIEEREQGNGNEAMTLVDLENVEDGGENGFVSPAELTKINFRSLIGHTDEVCTGVASNRPTEALASVIPFTFVTINTLNT